MKHNHLSATEMSGNDIYKETLTLSILQGIMDLPDIYTHVMYNILKKKTIETQLTILEEMSFINLKHEKIATDLLNVLNNKDEKELHNFIKSIKMDSQVAREKTIFRFDPRSILSVYLTHLHSGQDQDLATTFMRYMIHSRHLPHDMDKFLENYKNADASLRDALVPKTIYSWYNIE